MKTVFLILFLNVPLIGYQRWAIRAFKRELSKANFFIVEQT